jgi:hypothetical protein
MKATVEASPSLALVKYWGKLDGIGTFPPPQASPSRLMGSARGPRWNAAGLKTGSR